MITPVNDLAVHSQVAGTGPRVVLVHGLGEDARSWEDQQARIEGYELHAYDVRGHGKTDLGNADGSLRQLGEDLLGYLEQVGRAAVVGFSLGGSVALWAAAETLDLIPHVVSIGASSVVGSSAARFFQDRIDMLERGQWDEFRTAFTEDNRLQITSSHVDLNALVERRLDAIGSGGGYVNAAKAMAAFREVPLTPRLAAVRCPVAVVGAEHDLVCPRKAADIMVEALPNATYHEIPNAGHLMTKDAPAMLAKTLTSILDGAVL